MSGSQLRHFILAVVALISAPTIAAADEGGVSFWVPGFFGSLAAAPQQAGWSLTTFYYHTSVSAGGDVAIARERTLNRIPVNLNLVLSDFSADVNCPADLQFAALSYVLPTPILGGQAAFALLGAYGRVRPRSMHSSPARCQQQHRAASRLGRSRFPAPTASAIRPGFGDLIPQFSLRWNAGVNNYMVYLTGDIPVGAYDSYRLSNTGIGHGAFDGGVVTPISIRRPGRNSPACSVSPTT